MSGSYRRVRESAGPGRRPYRGGHGVELGNVVAEGDGQRGAIVQPLCVPDPVGKGEPPDGRRRRFCRERVR